MLIASHRHRPADLELWREYEAADMLHDVGSLQARSTAVIREFVRCPEQCYVGVSWGKDSVVVAHIVRQVSVNVPLVYLRQTTENPDCVRVRDEYLSRFPGQAYHEIEVRYGETVVSHANPAWKAAHKEAATRFGRRILGIRGDESGVRMIGLRTRGLMTGKTCSPIGWWTAQDVFTYMAQHGLPVHPVYAMLGGGRWSRHQLRTSSIGGMDGEQYGRREWEREYYGDVLRRNEAASCTMR